jgi:hypothetical protein
MCNRILLLRQLQSECFGGNVTIFDVRLGIISNVLRLSYVNSLRCGDDYRTYKHASNFIGLSLTTILFGLVICESSDIHVCEIHHGRYMVMALESAS